MTPEEMKAQARRYFEEGWNKRNLTVFDELAAPNFIYHHTNYPQFKDLDGLKKFATSVRASYPDDHITIHDVMAAERDRAVAHITWEGTSKGDSILTGGAPTGKHGTSDQIVIFRFEGDKVAEVWVVQDSLGLMRQLGYVLKKEGEE